MLHVGIWALVLKNGRASMRNQTQANDLYSFKSNFQIEFKLFSEVTQEGWDVYDQPEKESIPHVTTLLFVMIW